MRILLWHVHGSCTTALRAGVARVPAARRCPTAAPTGGAGPETWDWPASAVEVTPQEAADADVDVVVLQRPEELDHLAEAWLGGRVPGRDVPAIYLEHNAPQGRIERDAPPGGRPRPT